MTTVQEQPTFPNTMSVIPGLAFTHFSDELRDEIMRDTEIMGCVNLLFQFAFLQFLLAFLFCLSSEFWARQAQREVVKIKNLDFSYWAWSTSWGHVLSLKTFCRNTVLSWAIRYSVFQKVKFTSSLEFMCDDPFSTFRHLMVKFG